MCLGHEGAGVVDRIGPDVKGLKMYVSPYFGPLTGKHRICSLLGTSDSYTVAITSLLGIKGPAVALAVNVLIALRYSAHHEGFMASANLI